MRHLHERLCQPKTRAILALTRLNFLSATLNCGAKFRVGRQDGARAYVIHSGDILELKAIAVETDQTLGGIDGAGLIFI